MPLALCTLSFIMHWFSSHIHEYNDFVFTLELEANATLSHGKICTSERYK